MASVVLGLGAVAPAMADFEVGPARFEYRSEPPASAAAETPPATPAVKAVPEFGTVDTTWWSIGGGIANDFKNTTDYNLHVSFSYFLAQDIEAVAEAGIWYYGQDGKDAVGINPAFVLRWHFFHEEKWTVYTDIGIGVLLTSSDVPATGTSFNFTPRFGFGFTRELDDAGTRLQVGVRWAHVSNARITGNDDNVGRDSAMLYVGVIFPF